MQSVKLDGGRELELITQEHPLLGSLLRRIIEGANRTATNAGVGVNGNLDAPPPIDQTSVSGTFDATANTVTVNGEILHAVHTHNAPLNRGIKYLTEIATDPNFTDTHLIHDTTSRTVFKSLPTFNDSAQITYYMRTTTQMPGSAPSKPVVFGGAQGPTGILMTGASDVPILPSQAAGTARPGQGGKGLGPVQARPAVGGPKRTLPQK